MLRRSHCPFPRRITGLLLRLGSSSPYSCFRYGRSRDSIPGLGGSTPGLAVHLHNNLKAMELMGIRSVLRSQDVAVHLDGLVATIELTRPDRLNAMGTETLNALDQALTELESSEAAIAVVKGAGRTFCAGADITELSSATLSENDALAVRGQQLLQRLHESDIVSVAAVEGYAIGGGLELALACDLRIVSESAKLGSPESTLGHLPGWGATQRLPGLVGRGVALDLIISGRLVSAREARDIGLADYVVPDEEFDQAVKATVDRWTQRSRQLIVGAKRTVKGSPATVDPTRGFEIERREVAATWGLPQSADLRREFLNKKSKKR